ncbi:MAG: hypothetical protein J5622_00005, partial [Firmicutes bacterium]|nr:hypothetical protein [Bacillota bacterium]
VKYANSMGFTKDFPKITRYKEGEQWPAPTERTKNLPRPVFNITKMFIDRKRANVTNQSMAVNFKASEVDTMGEKEKALAEEGASMYTEYTAQLLEDMNMDELANEWVDDAASYGTGILHVYWDNAVTGGQSVKFTGDIRAEIIDPLDVVFARPKAKELQRQPHMIIRSRETVSAVRDLARALNLPTETIDNIVADEDESEQAMGQKSVQDNKECTVLTKYFRKNGQICFAKATKDVVLIEEEYLTPGIKPKKEEMREEDEVSGPEGPKPKEEEKHVINLYPVVVLPWDLRKKSIFGIGEAQDLMPINQAYNFLKAMQLLSVQDNGWPKTVVRKGMVEGKITNTPGETIVEKENGAIRYLNPPQPTPAASSLADEIFQMSRIISGVTDVSTGEHATSGISAAAIIALQNQAKTPVKEKKRRYKMAYTELARILLEFYKTYYSLERTIVVKDEAGNEKVKSFVGVKYANIDFKVSIDVGEATEYADELAITTLDKLYDRDKITLDQYMELAPAAVVPFKGKLQQMLNKEAEQTPEIPTEGGEMDVMQ